MQVLEGKIFELNVLARTDIIVLIVERKVFTFHYCILQLCQFFFCWQTSLLLLPSVVLNIGKSLFSYHDTISFLKLLLYLSSVFDIALKHKNMQSPQIKCGDKTKSTTKNPPCTTSPINTCTLLEMTVARLSWNPIVRTFFLF